MVRISVCHSIFEVLVLGPHRQVGRGGIVLFFDVALNATMAHMPTIASRELRNHTATVLDGVARGEVYTVTVHGRPVAEVRRVPNARRSAVPKADLMALLQRQRPDPTLARDMEWISEGTTDDLDDLG